LLLAGSTGLSSTVRRSLSVAFALFAVGILGYNGTRVRPGSHEGVAAALRLAIKEAFDCQASGDEPRQTLVPGAVRAGSRS
jgi:hypothetical protein